MTAPFRWVKNRKGEYVPEALGVKPEAVKPTVKAGVVKPLSAGDIAAGWQQTERGRMIYKADLATENAKETLVYDKIINAPSYPRLLAAYKRFEQSLYYKEDPYVIAKIQEAEMQPWELLTAHGGVMNAKSSRAKTLKSLADNVFAETKLPRLPEGKFRGESGLNWDAVKW